MVYAWMRALHAVWALKGSTPVAELNANQGLWLRTVSLVWLHQQGGLGSSIQFRVVIQQFSDTEKVMDFKEYWAQRGRSVQKGPVNDHIL